MRNKHTKGHLFHIDLDGTLAKGEFWGDGDPKPIQKNIDLVKALIRNGHHIIIWTARKEAWRAQTEYWLEKHDVWYHAIIMNKPPSDFYVDDKFITIEDLKKLI